MWRRFLRNRMMSSGAILVVLGIFGVILGYVALLNYSQTCYVNPGGFPCVIQYQVALLAPLYPLSVGLIGLGVLLAIIGAAFIAVGYSKHNDLGERPSIKTRDKEFPETLA